MYKVDTTATHSSHSTITIPQPIVIRHIYDLFDNCVYLRKHRLFMTQQELAKKLNYSRSTVSQAENYPEDVSLEYWWRFAQLLGLELQAPTFASLVERRAPWNDPSVRWVCEDHPTKDHGHRRFNWLKLRFEECGGAGMPEPTEENRRKGYLE